MTRPRIHVGLRTVKTAAAIITAMVIVELAGLCLVGAGVWWNNRQSQRAAQEAAGETAPSAR